MDVAETQRDEGERWLTPGVRGSGRRRCSPISDLRSRPCCCRRFWRRRWAASVRAQRSSGG